MSSIILAIDTSTRTIGLSLYNGIYALGESIWNTKNHHTVELAPAVEDLLRKCDIEMAELGALTICVGPGSYTGLRIGMGFAKGLSLANSLPIIGIPTLDVLAASQPLLNIPMVAVLQAGRGRLAVARYTSNDDLWTQSQELEILNPKELLESIKSRTYICGELNQTERRIRTRKHKNSILASPAQCLRRPSFLAEIGWKRWQDGLCDDPALITPIYLHQGEPIPG